MTRVKICGIRDVATAIAAAEAGADFIGLMFAESRRKVTPQECFEVVEALHEFRKQPGPVRIDGPARGDVTARSWFGAWNEAIEETLFRARPLIVGVFADQRAEDVNDIASAAKVDLVQLSGGENEDYIEQMDLPVFKAIHVGPGVTAEDIADKSVAGYARAIMLDTASAGARGGTGESFDWSVAAEAAERLPIMLAGGLRPENVAEAIRVAEPWAVDVSSGVETDGAKDIAKVQAFIAAAKGVANGH
jgi:phosphoribosylanthranilate isomerase